MDMKKLLKEKYMRYWLERCCLHTHHIRSQLTIQLKCKILLTVGRNKENDLKSTNLVIIAYLNWDNTRGISFTIRIWMFALLFIFVTIFVQRKIVYHKIGIEMNSKHKKSWIEHSIDRIQTTERVYSVYIHYLQFSWEDGDFSQEKKLTFKRHIVNINISPLFFFVLRLPFMLFCFSAFLRWCFPIQIEPIMCTIMCVCMACVFFSI